MRCGSVNVPPADGAGDLGGAHRRGRGSARSSTRHARTRETAQGDYDDFTVEAHSHEYPWRKRFPDAELLEAREGGAVYETAAEGAWWIVFDEGTMVEFLDDEDADIGQALVTLRRYDDEATWRQRVAEIRARSAGV